MPFILASGSILDSPAQALVNPVNCFGVAGAGLAKQFRDRWPLQVAEYTQFCKEGRMRPGTVHSALLPGGRQLISVPTKNHWSSPSTAEIVASGLTGLRRYMEHTGITSVAVPPLGCGLGGLNPARVGCLIRSVFSGSDADIHVYGWQSLGFAKKENTL